MGLDTIRRYASQYRSWSCRPGFTCVLSAVSAMSGSVFAGVMVGAMGMGLLSDRHGRRRTFATAVIWIIIFGTLSCFAPSVVWLTLCRAFMGFGVGGLAVVVLYQFFARIVRPRLEAAAREKADASSRRQGQATDLDEGPLE